MEAWLERLCTWVWGWPMMGLILTVGILFTIRLRFIQLRGLKTGLKTAFGPQAEGEGATPFRALCTALAATIGTGNIIGVASAISIGGPGALFWMLLAGFLGMATQYAEGLLAVRYSGPQGGGPCIYMEQGLGRKGRVMAICYAVCAVFAGAFGIGTVAQVHGISAAVARFFAPDFQGTWGLWLFGAYRPPAVVLAGVLVTVATAAVLLGGAERIGTVAETLVPIMAIGYILLTGALLLWNWKALPMAVGQVLTGALAPKAVTGGAVGSLFIVMRQGIARGLFTNEAGMGTAAIAAGMVRGIRPGRQGLASMTGTFIDTIVLCTLTGLAIVVTGAWQQGGDGVSITNAAFVSGLPFTPSLSRFVLMISLLLFAFATVIGWHYYAQRCLAYLTRGSHTAERLYRWLCIAAVAAAPYLSVDAVWQLADLTNGLMAFPNLLALLLLAGTVVQVTKAEHPE